jgi:hypothetical protein
MVPAQENTMCADACDESAEATASKSGNPVKVVDQRLESTRIAAGRSATCFSIDLLDKRLGFSIAHEHGGCVDIEVTCDGVTEGGLALDVGSAVAERTLSLELSRFGLAGAASSARDLAVSQVLCEARRVALTGNAPGAVPAPELDALEFLNAPDLPRRLLDDLVRVGFRADAHVGVTLYLCKITALLDAPVYVYLGGPACSLKTTYADLTANLTAPEMLKHLTDLTPKALYYSASDLRHFVIALDEMDLKGKGLAMDRKVLRMLFSKNWCEIETTQGGRSRRRRVQGPVMVIQTTTATEFDEQDESRNLMIELADSPERTDVVLGLMADQYAGLTDQDETQRIVEVHRSVHRLLPCGVEVRVPFAPILARFLPRDRIVVLRAFRALVSLVKACALLHYRHRATDGEGRILAALDDYRTVHEYAGELITHAMGTTRGAAPALSWAQQVLRKRADRAAVRVEAGEHRERALLQRLGEAEFIQRSRRWDEWMSLRELLDLTSCPRSTVQRYLDQLQKAGLVESQKSARALYYRLATTDGELPKCPRLPSPDEVEREHVGSSDKRLTALSIGCPPPDGQPITENNNDR